ncbi:group-specific protein [Priestia megaterium]|uniref:group-specific protein n=1 Tax=Priestia megaterium TaxID=1404 RepID=UPI00387931E2
MLIIEIDQEEARKLMLQKIEEKIKSINEELVFWDTKELRRRICMSWSTIQKEFFYDPRFPKHKVGSKWYFAALETEAFLLQWLKEKTDK